ncbi:hypothetical protein SteCoe_33863 [Stentor coeruleus]|uniref:Uncharacterized protein n=1 Tax=Stentor coeruleus TaxID=5963 RepID=A0A1R2AW59_9CILI|nr:hypothetical protein SteCoe_33863 [Stentor coeruleus]
MIDEPEKANEQATEHLNDLKSYLFRSKKVRDRSLKRAAKLVKAEKKKIKVSEDKASTSFPDITPQRFQKYSEKVNNQLKQFFNPQPSRTFRVRCRSLKLVNTKELFQGVYLNFRLQKNKIKALLNKPHPNKDNSHPEPLSNRDKLHDKISTSIKSKSRRLGEKSYKSELRHRYLKKLYK